MGLFSKREKIKIENRATLDAFLAEVNTPQGPVTMSAKEAIQIPAVMGAIQKISSTIAALPIKLYKKETDGTATEITDDPRVRLLNDDTGDTLTPAEMIKSFISDYYLANNGGYIYINKGPNNNQFISLHYVEADKIQVIKNVDPIFKSYSVTVNGSRFCPFQFLKMRYNTSDGIKNNPIWQSNSVIFDTASSSLRFERDMVLKGGNKRGVVEVDSGMVLDEGAIRQIKTAFGNLYNGTAENIPIYSGAKFKETSNTAAEMQLNELKKSNADDIYKLFGIPPTVLQGYANEQDNDQFIKTISVILYQFESALDRDLLLEKEKGEYFWAFDTSELNRCDILKRYQAYEIAYRNNFLQLDEIRKREDLKPFGFNYLKLGLADVLYDPATKQIFTPNTSTTTDLGDKKE